MRYLPEILTKVDENNRHAVFFDSGGHSHLSQKSVVAAGILGDEARVVPGEETDCCADPFQPTDHHPVA